MGSESEYYIPPIVPIASSAPAIEPAAAEVQEQPVYQEIEAPSVEMSEQDQAMALDYLQEAQSECDSDITEQTAPTSPSEPSSEPTSTQAVSKPTTDISEPYDIKDIKLVDDIDPIKTDLSIVNLKLKENDTLAAGEVTVQNMMLSQIDSELDRLISETKTQEESLSGLGALWNGAIGLAGFGTAGDINHYNELATMRDELAKNPDSDKINELYSQVFQQEADVKALQNSIDAVSELQQGTITLDSGVEINHEDIANALVLQANSLKDNFNNTVESQGMISSVIGNINNVVGIGTTENMTKAQLETFQDNVEKLSKTQDPHEFASLYVSITGENLSKESLEELFEGNSKVENSKASESMMDYEETNETIQNTAIAVGTGIAVASTGPIGAIAIGAGMSVGVNAVDAATQNNGKNFVENLVDYAQTDMVKDAACGAINGLTGKLGNMAGEKLVTTLASKGGTVVEGATAEALKDTLKTGQRIVTEFADGAVDGGLSAMAEYTLDSAAGENGNFTNNQGQIIDENGQLAFVNNLIENFDAGKMTQQALMGALMGGAMSVGMQELMRVKDNFAEKVADAKSGSAKLGKVEISDSGSAEIKLDDGRVINVDQISNNARAVKDWREVLATEGTDMDADEVISKIGENIDHADPWGRSFKDLFGEDGLKTIFLNDDGKIDYDVVRSSLKQSQLSLDGDIKRVQKFLSKDLDLVNISAMDLSKYESLINEIHHGQRLDSSLADLCFDIGGKKVAIKTDNDMVSQEFALSSDFSDPKKILTDSMRSNIENVLLHANELGLEISDTIYLTDLFSSNPRLGHEAYGYFSSSTNALYFNTKVMEDDAYLQEAIYHELGHLTDWARGKGNFISSQAGVSVGQYEATRLGKFQNIVNETNLPESVKNVVNYFINNLEAPKYTSSKKAVTLPSGETLSPEEITTCIREYATRNNQEFVAEVTANLANGKIVDNGDGTFSYVSNKIPICVEDGVPVYAPNLNPDYNSLQKIMELYKILTQGKIL